jgi:hypothetical protein
MKVFYTPVINGEYAFTAQRRMEDQADNSVYTMIKAVLGQDGVDALDDKGYVKLFTRDNDNKVTGYFTYQQDDL